MHAPGRGKGAQGRGSIIFDHEGAPCTDGRYYRHCRGRWRGVLSKGFGPDGKRKRYKVSGLTKQDVIEALRKKSEEINAGLSTSRPSKVEAAAHVWLEHGLPIGAHAERFTGMRWPRSQPRSASAAAGPHRRRVVAGLKSLIAERGFTIQWEPRK